MPVFDRYLFKNLFIATALTALTLASVILLTQSLGFMELVMDSGASGGAFWTLTILALPRFFEVILPVALMASTVFVYNRMTMDSELTVMRALGSPPMKLARPALVLALIVTVALWGVTGWVAPLSLGAMNYMRTVIKAQVSTLLFHEGVFNTVGKDLTVFVREKTKDGDMQGILIHDGRAQGKPPITIIAKRGSVITTPLGQQVVVFDGSRQDMNEDTGTLSRLDFQRYIIDLPSESTAPRERWKEPDERTLPELLAPDSDSLKDPEIMRAFRREIHRRIVSPLLSMSFAALGLALLLLGPVDRRGQTGRVALCALGTVAIEGLYMASFNIARTTGWGIVLMYALVFVPLIAGLFLLGGGTSLLQKRPPAEEEKE